MTCSNCHYRTAIDQCWECGADLCHTCRRPVEGNTSLCPYHDSLATFASETDNLLASRAIGPEME